MTDSQRKKYKEAAAHHKMNHCSFHSSILAMQEESFLMGCEFAHNEAINVESRKVVPFESFLPRALDMKTGNMYYERDVLEAAKKFAKQFEP